MGVPAANDAAAKTAKQLSDADWVHKTTNMMLDLRTSDFDIMKATNDLFSGDNNMNQARVMQFQHLLSMRSNLVAAMSNIMKTLSETVRLVIQNFRA